MHDNDRIQKILLNKRKKYKLTSVFAKQRSLIVDFISLTKITSEYCQQKTVLKDEMVVQSFYPVTINEEIRTSEHASSKVELYELENVLVVGNSSFFLNLNKDKLFYENFPQDEKFIYIYNDANISFHSDSLAKIKNFKTKKCNFDAIYLGGTFTNNYYHFLIEILSKAEYLHHIPNSKDLTVVLDISISENENLREIAAFFLKDYKIKFLERNFFYEFKKLWYITTPNPTVPNIIEGSKYESQFTKLLPESIQFLRQICLENYDESRVKIKAVSKVYIARKSELRKYNTVEILEISKKYGFEPVYFEDLNIHEQIFIINNADYIIGSSGAAWTNLLFAKENSKGLMWLGSVWGDFSVFSTLAKLVNFNLFSFRYECKSSDFHQDYFLNLKDFENNLQQLLEL